MIFMALLISLLRMRLSVEIAENLLRLGELKKYKELTAKIRISLPEILEVRD